MSHSRYDDRRRVMGTFAGKSFRHQFSSGARPLAGDFRSLYLLPDVSADGNAFSLPTAALANWIGAWDSWYLARLRAAKGGLIANQYLLYEREVALSAPPLAPDHRLACIEPIAEKCRDLALSFALEFPIDDDGDLVALRGLIGSVVPWCTTLKLTSDCPQISSALWHSTLDALVRARTRVHIDGPIAFIRSIATTSSALLNARTHSYGPAAVRPVAPVAGPGCGLRFSVFVAADGAIYPCRALIGLTDVRLGSIFDEIEDTALGGAPHLLDLASLSRNGPGCDQMPTVDTRSREPQICIRHRRFLERLQRHGSLGSRGSDGDHPRAT